MAVRSDVTVDFTQSPRVATIAYPSTKIAAQDIVDTLRVAEESWRGQSETKLLNASGKEDIGDGVQVGITVSLQNTVIAFAGRTDAASVGVITTDSDTPVNGFISLIDNTATFITDAITRGSLVINFTDNSIAEVYGVVSETQLITNTLIAGVDNSFDINDNYKIFNVEQCEVTGGNLVAVDDTNTAILATLGTPFTQVIKSASSSATLISASGSFPTASENAQAVWEYSAAIVVNGSHGQISRRTAFQDHIHIDQNDGTAGTAFPLGTAGHPVNNIADAVTIAITEGIHVFRISEDITIKATDDVSGYKIFGAHASKSEIIIEDGARTDLAQFTDCSLIGTLNGFVIVRDSVVEDLIDFQGILHQVAINPGGIKLANGSPTISFLLDCYSGVPGVGAPEIDFNNTSQGIAIRGYNGGLKIVNKTTPAAISIDFASGQCILDGTVTAGEIVIRGIYHLTDNSTGTTNVVQNTNLDIIEIKIDNIQTDVDAIEVTLGNISLVIDDLIKYQRNKSIIDPVAYTLTIYEDDEVTPLTVFDLKDSNGVASILSIFQRLPR